MGGEGERDWGPGWGLRVSWARSSLVDLKHKSRNLEWEKKTNECPNSQLLDSTKSSETKEPQRGRWPGSLSSRMARSLHVYRDGLL